MSRLFDGQFGVESVTFSVGTAPAAGGPVTIALLFRPQAAFAGAVCYGVVGKNGSTEIWGQLYSSQVPFMSNDFGAGGPTLSTNVWYWVVCSKVSAGTPRWHVKDITNGTAWVHQNDTATVADGSGPITTIIFGNDSASGGSDMRGEVVAAAVWNSSLADAAVQSACTLQASDLAAAAPQWGTLWNQASTATPVNDFTGGGGNQTAISGTSVSANEPPGWSYSLGAAGPVGRQLLIPQSVRRASLV